MESTAFIKWSHLDLNQGPPDYEILNRLFLALPKLTYFNWNTGQ